jgi:hypothetical protein
MFTVLQNVFLLYSILYMQILHIEAHIAKVVIESKVVIEAHPQHWKALRQALTLVKRVYVQRDVTPGYWDRGPKA